MYAPITNGTLDEKNFGRFQWWIEPATSTRTGICVYEAQSGHFLSWIELRQRVTESGNILAMAIADRIDPQMTGPYCGRITVPSLDVLAGMQLETFLRFVDTFLRGTLREFVH